MNRIEEIKQNIKEKVKIKIILISNSIYEGHFTTIFPTNDSNQTLAYFTDKHNHRVSVIVEDISVIEYIGGFSR